MQPSRKKILFIGGSLNQTSIAHAVARPLQEDFDCYFTPYFCDGGILLRLQRAGWLDFTVMGGKFRKATDGYLRDNQLPVDYAGAAGDYDLVVTTSDLLIQQSIRGKPIVLIQEGMTDPEGVGYHLVRHLGLPRYIGSTATTGLSDAYQVFCVASEGYRDLFIRKGVCPGKLAVTGIPNFDNIAGLGRHDFVQRDFVLVATSDTRETFKRDDRKQFIRRCIELAGGRPLVFKLHPNENVARSTGEIHALLPDATVLATGDIGPMIAGCQMLICQYSSVAFIGLALGKEVHSSFDIEKLRKLQPIQNGGTSHLHIASICRRILDGQRAAVREKNFAPRMQVAHV